MMKPFVGETVDRVRFVRNRIYVIVKKFIHHQDCSVGDVRRPFVDMIQKSPNDLLRAEYSFDILVRFRKKTMEPLFATDGTGKIEFVKNREFLFRVKDRNVFECGFVDVHNESSVVSRES